jgi:hypothetical protein
VTFIQPTIGAALVLALLGIAATAASEPTGVPAEFAGVVF